MTTTDTRTPIWRRRWAQATGAVLALALIGGAAAGGATLAASRTTVIRPAAATAPAPAAPRETAPPAQAQAPRQAPTVIINNNPPAAQPALPAPAPAGTYGYTYAGDGVWAGPNTSAPFALAVHQAWLASGEAGTVEAYSPVTHQWYVMTQTGSDPYVYQGGNGASIEFWS